MAFSFADFFSNYRTSPDPQGNVQTLRELLSGLEHSGAGQSKMISTLFGALGNEGLSPFRRRQFERAASYGGLQNPATLRELARGVTPGVGEGVAPITDFLLGADNQGGALARGNPFAKQGDVSFLLGAQPGGGGGVGDDVREYLFAQDPGTLTGLFQSGQPTSSIVDRSRRRSRQQAADALGTGIGGIPGFGETQRLFGVPRTTAKFDRPPDATEYTDVDPNFWQTVYSFGNVSPDANYMETISGASPAFAEKLRDRYPEIATQVGNWTVAQVLAQNERTWTEQVNDPDADPNTVDQIKDLLPQASRFRASYGYWPSFIEAEDGFPHLVAPRHV